MSSTNEKQDRFMRLYEPVQRKLEHFALAMTRNSDAAREVVGDTLLVAYEQFDRLRHPEAFLSFLFTIATRTYRRQQKRAGIFSTFDERHSELLHDTAAPPDLAADIAAVYAAIDRLPEKQREAVVMFELLGFSMKEIRDVQGGTLVGVKVRVSRGRQKLATILGVDARGNSNGQAVTLPDDGTADTEDLHNLYSLETRL
jgi:RNA polymerase sigma-70 factor (ECF subfamily)